MYIDTNEAVKRIRTALKRRTGTSWSVTRGKGTGYCWLKVAAPPSRRVGHDRNPAWNCWDMESTEPPYFERPKIDSDLVSHTSNADAQILADIFGRPRHHCQPMSISPDEHEWAVFVVEGA